MSLYGRFIACTVMLAAVSSSQYGPSQRAGEKVDHAVDTLKNGGEEPTRDKLRDKADKARTKTHDTADDPGKEQ